MKTALLTIVLFFISSTVHAGPGKSDTSKKIKRNSFAPSLLTIPFRDLKDPEKEKLDRAKKREGSGYKEGQVSLA